MTHDTRCRRGRQCREEGEALQTERIEGAGQDAGRAAGLAGSSLWLISRDKGGSPNPPLEPLLVDDDRSGGTLAVFGHEEEAEMFLWFGALGGGWRVREAGARELASFLCGPSWPGVRRVALDPLPGNLAGAAFDLPVGIDRDRFAQRLARVAPRG